jgi:hypothetical protein
MGSLTVFAPITLKFLEGDPAERIRVPVTGILIPALTVSASMAVAVNYLERGTA